MADFKVKNTEVRQLALTFLTVMHYYKLQGSRYTYFVFKARRRKIAIFAKTEMSHENSLQNLYFYYLVMMPNLLTGSLSKCSWDFSKPNI